MERAERAPEFVTGRLAPWARHLAWVFASVVLRAAWFLRGAIRIALLALATTAVAAQALGPTRVKGLDELLIQMRLVHGVPVSMVQTNHGTLWVVIDTGAEVSILDDALCGKSQTICMRVQAETFCGTPLRASEVPQFVRLQSVEGPPQIKAVLGNDILRKFDEVLFDYRNGSIRFSKIRD